MLFAAVFLTVGLTTALGQMRFTRPPPTMMPQCQCSDLSNCMQQEQQQMQSCTLNAECVALLGGDQAKVNNCLTQRNTRISNEESCLENAIGIGNMGCTNSTSPTQLPVYRYRGGKSSQDYNNYDDSDADTSPTGQYFSCVQKCLNSTAANSRKKRDATGFCPAQLNCALDKSVMQSAGPVIWNALMNCGSQSQSNSTDVSDCQCLADAGVS